MPIYEYSCSACNHQFETLQKYSDAPVTSCPQCNGAVQKLMSLSGFQLKGSGWYNTDYKKSSANPKAASEAAPAATACSGTPASCAKPDCGSKN